MPPQFPRQITGFRVFSCRLRDRHATLQLGKTNPTKSEIFNLNFILGGKIEIRTVTRVFVADKGCCFIGEPGGSMVLKALPGAPPSYYSMGFMPQSESNKPLSLMEMGLEPIFRVRSPGKIEKLLKEISGVFNGHDKYRQIKCSILGLQLLLALNPLPGSFRIFPHLPDNRDSYERLDDAIVYIHLNFKRRIPLKTLADKASLHPNNFIHAFRKATGLTPHQYLLNLKIEKAKDFLLFYKESPAVAALELGFHDYAHFSRVFKRHTALSPKQYRDRNKSA